MNSPLTDDEIRQSRWYYQAELRPGVYTGGREHFTAAMVREMLERTNLKGAHCLDIGTQEALIAVSLARLGAKTVVAYDRLDLSARINLIKEAYGVDFDYQHGLPLNKLAATLKEAGYSPFDIVVFAGVLYHMIDPLTGLGTIRSFVRENGLVIVETAAKVSDEMVLYFNARGSIYGMSSNYFLPSLSCLDYFLRMLRLKPIDCRYIGKNDIGSPCRVAVVCRAIDKPLAFPNDTWMAKPWVENDFRPLSLDYAALASSAPAVGYETNPDRLYFHPETDSVDLFKTVVQSPTSLFLARNRDRARLNLADYLDQDKP